MQKTEGDCEEMDESNALMSESPKKSVHLNDESMIEKGKQTFFCNFFLGLLYLAVLSLTMNSFAGG